MCGIAGFWQLGVNHQWASEIVQDMARRVYHRGPNSSGIWVDEGTGIALGHRRLAVIDVSDAGNQPMVSSCGRWVIIFNGEIYNHLEIRRDLEKSGCKCNWRGHSDTETLLEAFSVWDTERVLNATVGMFAFALWDREKKSLVLARDRTGEKPLYYGWQNNAFIFASELKSFYAHPAFKNEIEHSTIGLFLTHNYIPSPYSIYKGIYKLPPASWISLQLEEMDNKKLPSTKRYWSFNEVVSDGIKNPFLGSVSDAADELEKLLLQAVSGQMLSDVPLGAFLSGGIDSSTIVSLMQSQTDAQVTTFSIGVPEAQIDETRYASAVAKYLGTNHISHNIAPEKALSIIPNLCNIWDEPFADSSQVPTWLVCKLASQHVTVSLSGDGADECFLGYNRYRNQRLLWKYRWVANLPVEVGAGIYRQLKLPGSSSISFPKIKSTKVLLKAKSLEEMISVYSSPYRGDLLPIADGLASTQLLPGGIWQHPGELVDPSLLSAWYDASYYLPDDILQKVDRASMSVSLETRAPFLDHRVIEFAWRLPLDYKLKGRSTKRILREVLFKHLPSSLFNRPKQGFSIPVAKWLREELKEWAETVLDRKSLVASGFNDEVVHFYWNKHLNGEDYSERLWGILMFRSFMEREING